MHIVKLVVLALLSYAFFAAYDKSSRATLDVLPFPWMVATVHLGVGLVYVFPLWAMGIRHPPKLSDIQKKEIFPLGFLFGGVRLLATAVRS
ncbi:unnamed protein product, partial [Discosporangium mesarthrocarpum]